MEPRWSATCWRGGERRNNEFEGTLSHAEYDAKHETIVIAESANHLVRKKIYLGLGTTTETGSRNRQEEDMSDKKKLVDLEETRLTYMAGMLLKEVRGAMGSRAWERKCLS